MRPQPATQADLRLGFKQILARLDSWFKKLHLTLARIERKFDLVHQETATSHQEFLKAEKAMIDQLRDHERRLKQLEIHRLLN